MDRNLVERREGELLRSPGGCALLLKAAEVGLTPAEIVDPVTSMHLVSSAIGEIGPFIGVHDAIVHDLLDEGQQHRDLAARLVREPGIERWWAPLDRERQVWIEPETRIDLTRLDPFPTPDRPPSRWEIYAQHPEIWVTTSTEIDGWTSQLANLVSGMGDWHMNYPARRARARVVPDAKVYEVVSAEDWHQLVALHGVRSQPHQTPHPDTPNQPWGANDGLVPDWQAVASAWDGVHLTLWAYLTATQVRVESAAGWSELWSWEGEQTTWLRWVFDAAESLSTLATLPERRDFPLPWRLYRHYRPQHWSPM